MTDKSMTLYFREIMKAKYNPIEDQKVVNELINIAQNGYNVETKEWTNEGIEARDKIINSNIRFAPYLLNKIIKISNPLYMDCLNEAFFIIERSILGYDPSYNYNFSTYYQVAFRRHIWRYLRDHGNVVRLPSTEITKRSKKEKLIYKSNEAVDRLLKNDFDSLNYMASLDYQSSETKINNALNTASMIHNNNPLESIMEEEIMTSMMDSFKVLNEREKIIISNRYLNDKKMNLEDISKIVNLSGERVRQIETIALRKMRECMKS